MGRKHNIVRHKNWQEKREVQYWTRLLNITESEAQSLAETMNKPVDTRPPQSPYPTRGKKKAPDCEPGLRELDAPL
jgi:hypothetical protein